jgi:hypothetical protein
MSKHSMRSSSGSAMSRSSASASARVRALLRALFGQQPRQRQLGALGRHLQPDAALLARLVHRAHARARCLGQRLDQRFGSTAWLVTSSGGTAWPM